MKLVWIAVAAAVALAACGEEERPPAEPKPVVRVGGATVRVEVADDEASRQLGLGGRDTLSRDHGMLFLLPNDQPSFWMKGMRFPIDIVWIHGNEVVDVTADVPPPRGPGAGLPTYSPDRPADRALEVNAGWAARHGVRPGDTVRVRPRSISG